MLRCICSCLVGFASGFDAGELDLPAVVLVGLRWRSRVTSNF